MVTDDVNDLAADFVEQEVGRLDWVKNLNLLKDTGKLAPRLSNWLSRMGYSRDLHEPVLAELDRLVTMPGRWT